MLYSCPSSGNRHSVSVWNRAQPLLAVTGSACADDAAAHAFPDRWGVSYFSEAFFIEIDDAFKDAMLNYELSNEYKLSGTLHLALASPGSGWMSTAMMITDRVRYPMVTGVTMHLGRSISDLSR